MKRFIQGEHRTQSTLLPEVLDDYVTEENPVRVVDVFIDNLDLQALGFEGVTPAVTGRPSYHPVVLLKLYVYGYLNRIQSSRRLEREAQRNIELMWLTGRLTPDFKTIANFRKDNGTSIRNVCRQFVALCQKLDLFAESLVTIDGSKFKAVNNRDKNFTKGKVEHRMKEIESSINQYLTELDTADRHEPEIKQARTERLQQKIVKLQTQMKQLATIKEQLDEAPDHQLSQTDPDARSMRTRGSGIVGYNVQTAVDTKHHLIVAHEVTTDGNDRDQLCNMATQARDAMGVEQLTAIGDRGYYKNTEILACDQANIKAIVAKSVTSTATAEGRFGKDDFIYDAANDVYRCPADQLLTRRTSYQERGEMQHRYWTSGCKNCPLKSQCTPGSERRVTRWENEAVLDDMQRRLDHFPQAMRIRRETVEHTFGTIKFWMGTQHFLMRTLKHVATEMSLHVLAYNMKRMIKILGIIPLMQAMVK
ncbi:IS1182 family transposase [Sapientia aquatica]|uniref:IS1182 family transposase n=1 Tax=Sapientia aquatica TaxID=1549640 RepID=A0A4R5W222_9BURK|nr:IS1182 family transposase [Sapientia aquatica]TDK66383.1 IS1182 family transposase [Sapientia aquatica]